MLAVAICVVGVSFGALAVSRGEPPWVPLVMSLTVFAAGAQFASLDLALSGTGTATAVAAGLVLNARLALFGFALSGLSGPRPGARLLAGSQLLVDQSAALALAERDPAARRRVFLACGGALYAAWNLGTLVGVLAGSALSDPGTLGLDAAEPMVLLALVLPALRRRQDGGSPTGTRRTAATGAALALAAAPFLPPGTPVLLALLGLLVLGRPSPAADASGAASERPDSGGEPGPEDGPGPGDRSGANDESGPGDSRTADGSEAP